MNWNDMGTEMGFVYRSTAQISSEMKEGTTQ